MIDRPDNLPVELMFRVRPAGRPDLHLHVAEHVAEFCWQQGISEQMIYDIRMGEPLHGIDEEGSFSQVTVRFIYR